jgi:hypothetical protein
MSTPTSSDLAHGNEARDPENRLRELEASLLRRVDQVEHEGRRLRRQATMLIVGVGALLGVGAALVVGFGRGGIPGITPGVVEARSFVVRDPAHGARAALGIMPDGSLRLTLSDASGRARAKLGVLDDGSAALVFSDSAGTARAVLGVLGDGTTNLVLADSLGRGRTVLGLAVNGSSTLAFSDQGGATRAGLGVDARGSGTFSLTPTAGDEAPTDEPGPPADSAKGPTRSSR